MPPNPLDAIDKCHGSKLGLGEVGPNAIAFEALGRSSESWGRHPFRSGRHAEISRGVFGRTSCATRLVRPAVALARGGYRRLRGLQVTGVDGLGGRAGA